MTARLENPQERNAITTWADGFGRWHGRVTFPAPGYGPQYLDGHIDAIRAAARAAIRKQLRDRGELGEGYRLSLEVYKNQLNSLNQMQWIEYAEAGTWDSEQTRTNDTLGEARFPVSLASPAL